MRDRCQTLINAWSSGYRRLPLDLFIEYWAVDQSRSRPGRLVEINMDGFWLNLREKVEVGEKLRISILIDSGADYLAVEPLVEIVWINSSKQSEGCFFQSKVRIIEISERESEILDRYLKDCKVPRASRGPKWRAEKRF